MGLSKFDAGRLHRMRSGKSYLCAHPSWDEAAPTPCSSCNKAPETFEHAILHCPAMRPARTQHLQGVTDIGPDAPVWSSATHMGALTRFVRSTATAFPRPACFPSRLPPLIPFLPACLMLFPLGTFCRLRKARFTYFLVSTLSAGLRRVSFDLLGLISCPYVGLGPVRIPVEQRYAGYFLC